MKSANDKILKHGRPVAYKQPFWGYDAPMDRLVIEGGRRLAGTIPVMASKNAALPVLIATLSDRRALRRRELPDRPARHPHDGPPASRAWARRSIVEGSTVRVESTGSLKTQAPYDIVKQMRASVLAAGPLLARFGLVRVPIPGGCGDRAARSIDIHLKGLEASGAAAHRRPGGHHHGSAPRLTAAAETLAVLPSVGATENLMMAAAVTPGRTVIKNAAREPEIGDLGAFLAKLGAKVSGAGTATVSVAGTRWCCAVRATG